MNNEYISRTELVEALLEIFKVAKMPRNVAEAIASSIPSADVVEVIRCKDCKWFNLNKWAEVDGAPIIVGHEICDFWGGGCKTKEDGYCSYGERKDNEKVRD